MSEKSRPYSAAPRFRLFDPNQFDNKKSVLQSIREKVSNESLISARFKDWEDDAKQKSVKDLIKEKVGDLKYPEGFLPSANTSIKSSHDSSHSHFQQLKKFPGGLSMPSIKAKTYFGSEARTQFFDRQQAIQRQRSIISTEHNSEYSPPPEDIVNTDISEDFAFRPNRSNLPIEFSANIVIRTKSSINESSQFDSHMKFIAKNASFQSKPAIQAIDESSFKFNDFTTSLSEISEFDEAENSIRSNLNKHSSNEATRSNMLFSPQSTSSLASASPSPTSVRGKRPSTSNSAAMNRRKSSAKGGEAATAQRLVALETANMSTKGNAAGLSVIPPLETANIKSKAPSMTVSSHSNINNPISQFPPSTTAPRRNSSYYSVESDCDNFSALSATKEHNTFTDSFISESLNFELNQSEEEPIHLVCVEAKRRCAGGIVKNRGRRWQHGEDKRSNMSISIGMEMDTDADSVTSMLVNCKNAQGVFSRPNVSLRRGAKANRSNSPERSIDNLSVDNLVPGDLSPRSRYIDACIRKKLNPRLSLILRKNFTKCLDLQHHGIGDEMAVLFAEAIVDIPYVESLNIADNNLTDRGLSAVIDAVSQMKDLIDLNVSYNVIGQKAAASLSSYLASSSCSLIRLALRRADVDDMECERIVSSLSTNRSLTDLDLSENLVGSHEQLNTVLPDITTGAEALAELLTSPHAMLQTLKLGWNMIRLDSGNQLCQAIGVNNTITYLDLSYNALGNEGGQILGSSLLQNQTLKVLMVAHNSINSMACVTICAGVLENEGLSKLVMDGNPIGVEGAKALMLLPTMAGFRIDVSASSCNLGIKDPKNWFSTSNICSTFHLTLSDPFHRAIAILLMHIVACHRSYKIGNCVWVREIDGKMESSKVDLVEKVVVDFASKRLSAPQLKQIEVLRKVKEAAENTQMALDLFNEVDEDGSGLIDEDELGQMMKNLGMEVNEEKAKEVVVDYDMDQRGGINLEEFLLFLRHQLQETNSKLNALTMFPIMGLQSDASKTRYVPPAEGKLTVTIADGMMPKEHYKVISDSDRDRIQYLAAQSGELVNMTTYGIQSYRIRYGEALSITEAMLKESSNRIFILGKVLPQLATASDARKLANKVLKNSKIDMARLKRELGAFTRPIFGNPDGFYSLDLTSAMDRLCISRLIEWSSFMAFTRSSKSMLGYGYLGDCSQSGNWSCFRNITLNGKLFALSTTSIPPRSGKLEFDFVSQRRCGPDDFKLSDVRVVNTLISYFLLRADERERALERLETSKKQSNRTLKGDAKTVYERPMRVAKEISLLCEDFYNNLNCRAEQVEESKQKEAVKVALLIDAKIEKIKLRIKKEFILSRRNVQPLLSLPSLDSVIHLYEEHKDHEWLLTRDPRSSLTPIEVAKHMVQKAGSILVPSRGKKDEAADSDPNLADDDHVAAVKVFDDEDEFAGNQDISDEDEDEDDEDNSAGEEEEEDEAAIAARAEKKPLDEWMLRYVRLLGSPNLADASRAAKVVEVLVEAFEHSFLMCRHMELMCDLFQILGTTLATHFFGTYRVELVVTLFGCLVDLHNFELVLRALTSFEAACVICRVGWLNIFNPLKPQGAYELDLSRHEERVIYKYINVLGTNEAGENFHEQSFRWERGMDPIPGFVLTVPWMTEEGLPRNGFANVYYYCGEGTEKNGCKANLKLRKAMTNLVLINEEEVREESAPLLKKTTEESFLQSNLVLWYGYLAYNEAEYKLLVEAKAKENSKKKPKVKRKK